MGSQFHPFSLFWEDLVGWATQLDLCCLLSLPKQLPRLSIYTRESVLYNFSGAGLFFLLLKSSFQAAWTSPKVYPSPSLTLIVFHLTSVQHLM
jgi:hypothetical protein